MIIYVITLTTMEDSPEVSIISVTANNAIAKQKLKQAEAQAQEWMQDLDEDSSDWAKATLTELDIPGTVYPGDTVTVAIVTEWLESIDSEIKVFPDNPSAESFISEKKKTILERYENIIPFDDDETIEESSHLADDSVMVDYYFTIENVVAD